MFKGLDRTGDLFGSEDLRERFIEAINIAGFGAPRRERDLRDQSFTEAARLTFLLLRGDSAAETEEGRRQVDEVVVLARHLVRCGYAMGEARRNGEHVGEDWTGLLGFVKEACALMAAGAVGTAWMPAFAYITERCEAVIQPRQADADRDDAYAALRYLATELSGCGGFKEQWNLKVGEPEG
jgi:hypothetical protein